MPDTTSSNQLLFSTTRWSLVANAADRPHSLRSQEALEQLLQRYLPALRAHLMHRLGRRTGNVEDLLQGFVADKVVAGNLCMQADREKGRFRSFLLTAMDNYIASHYRYVNAKRRRAATPDVDIDNVGAIDAREHSPDACFDVAWAKQVIFGAIDRTEALYRSTGRSQVFELFKRRILDVAEPDECPSDMTQLANELGFDSARQASNALAGAKRNFARMLREAVRAYAPDEDVDEELIDLRTILARYGATRRS